MRKINFFIGVDVSKDTLDLAVQLNDTLLYHSKIDNETLSIKEFWSELKLLDGFKPDRCTVGMEHTGIYCNLLLNFLNKARTNIVLENALHIRNSLGNIRGKTDKIDAVRIASYLYKSRQNLKIWSPKRVVVQELASLSTLRNRLIKISQSLRIPIKEESSFINTGFAKRNENLCSNSISSLKTDINNLEILIEQIWRADSELNRLMTLIMSVPSVGPITALQIIVSTNEFKDIDSPKKFASYCGIAPFQHQSGKSLNSPPRVSQMANKKMKSLIHTCAVSARRYSPEISNYFNRKTIDQGKHKMSVLNAIRCKLILRIFACVNENRKFILNYSNSNNIEL